MRGSLKQRSPGSWTLILDLGYVEDAATGRRKRRQQWITVRGTKRDAETRLNTLLTEATDGTFVTPSKRTVGAWLSEWVEKAIKPPMRTPRAYETYCSVIALHLEPVLGEIRLQALKALDLERYYATKAAFGLVGVRMRVAVLSSSWSSGVSSAIGRGFFFWPVGGAGHRNTRIGRPPATTVAVRRLASHQPRKVRREYRLSAEASAIRLKC